ncbi:MAG TPA: EamA family transporter [Planctomycetota bacterium]|nr:EamA family transporter [Planctomycetota bacterium]
MAGSTVAALIGFAANSLLCRMALRPGLIDAASFTGIRLLSGAIVLSLLVRSKGEARSGGSWVSAVALFAYAAAFSFAYLRIEAGAGALILFGSVQITMVGWGWFKGERPRVLEWVGLAVAFGGLAVLTIPGAGSPDLVGAGLMASAGVAWGAYSLRGRSASRALADTSGNFLRSVPLAAVLAVVAASHVSLQGALLAVASGAVASGIGYSLWYAALPGLTATRAAVVQLSVPVLAAAGGVALLGESPSMRLAGAGLAILGGVGLALLGRFHRQS